MVTPSHSVSKKLLPFLDQSPTPFHAVATMAEHLESAGFQPLQEGDTWHLEVGKAYWVTRNNSSIIAFRYLPEQMQSQGIAMLGAHTDSPCLKVKPNPELNSNGYFQLGVEPYGGVLLSPWFDRDLSLAGKVVYRSCTGQLISTLINFKRPIAVIPNIAIHLHRDANETNKINKQTHLPPVLMQAKEGQNTYFRDLLADELKDSGIDDCDAVLDYELSFYDTHSAAVIGLQSEFIASARLDNLLSCFIAMQALIAAKDQSPILLACHDHEEVGSTSACGAQGPMLNQCLQRILPDDVQRLRVIDRSMMISVDNAHGIHPNYADKHDSQHGPRLNKGPVIKVNANQRYATNSETSSWFKHLCKLIDVPVQEFVTRSDLGCGSTIGPITAAEMGMKTLDVGAPTFAMHSIRELAGVADTDYLLAVLTHFLNTPIWQR